MTKKREKPLHIDMSFDEALKRSAQTDPRELKKSKKTTKKRSKSSLRSYPPARRPDPQLETQKEDGS
jgi:hypothetical protein